MTVKIFMAVAAVLCLLCLSYYVNLLPRLLDAVTRGRRAVELEHNLQLSRERNLCAAVILFVYAIICDRFKLFPADFMDATSEGWSICLYGVMIVTALYLRKIIVVSIFPRALTADEQAAARNSTMNGLCLFLPVFLLTAAVGHFFTDDVMTMVFYAEIILVILLSTIRCAEILSFHCGGFATILYLCAADLPPVGLLIAAAYFL